MGIEVKDIAKLTATQKVAIVLLSLSDDNATRIFSLMSEEEITDISHAMSNLGSVAPEAVDSVMDKLSTDMAGDSTFFGNLDNTERLLQKILDKDRVDALIDEIRGPQGKNTWEKLANVNEELLALYFRNEHPQTAALVLSKIAPDHAAKVLSNLPDSFAFEIISRILSMGSVKKEVLERVEKILRAEFISSVGKTQKYDSIERLVGIFGNLDRSTEVKFMTMLESNLPEAATKIKDMMFTFDDLLKIDSKGIQRLLRDVEKSRLTLALKGASDELKKMVFSSMSQRAAKIIEEDIMSLGSVRMKDVDAARFDVVSVAKGLIENGEIDVSLDNEEEEFVT
ncbi:MAG: flagellar motor switch protein FliG [Rickettsiales bacterium]|nr:MAG: flagellar motor switch protein FliG [Rickettsiales bacterium]